MRLAKFNPLICPHCGQSIERRQLKEWACPACNGEVGLAHSYRVCLGLLTFFAVALFGLSTYEPTSDGSWLLRVILSAVPFWLFLGLAIPPWLKRGPTAHRVTIVSSYLGAAAIMFIVEFLGFGTAVVLLGSKRELQEHLFTLSLPLVWISPKFLITPDKSFADVCGIILGNSFFLGLLLYGCYQPVRWAFRRSRPTRLSITDKDTSDDED